MTAPLRRLTLGLTLLGALLVPLRATAQPGGGVPRDEPEPMDRGGPPAPPPAAAPPAPASPPTAGSIADLPDYGPSPDGDVAPPARRPRPVVPPLVIKRTPRFKLTYQRFTDHKLGGQATPFNVGALTFFPLSGWVRLGATLRLGVEQSSSKRSYFVDALVTGGVQWPEAVRGVTPFVDFNVGPGFRMFTTFNNSLPSLQWTFGLDVGAEVYLVKRLYLSAALGWTRPVVSIKQASVGRQTVDVYGDTFIFKLGFGI